MVLSSDKEKGMKENKELSDDEIWVSASESESESECESEESLLYEKAKVAAFERAMQDMVIDRNLRGNISKYPIAKRYDDRGNHEDINGSDQNVNHLRKNPSLSSRLKKETGPLEMNPKQLRCKVCTLLPPCNHISVKSESSSLEKLQNECAYLSDESMPDEEIGGSGVQVLDVGDVVNYGSKRGKIVYIGEVHYTRGIMIGMIMDDPVGKNDGSVKGQRYFKCSPGYGLMVRAVDLSLSCIDSL